MKLSTFTALIVNFCWLTLAHSFEHSYKLNLGLSYYFNEQSKKLDGSPCDTGKATEACDVVLRLAAAPCQTCRVTQEMWYPSENESYNDSSELDEHNFGSRHLSLSSLSVNSTNPRDVVLFLTIWDKDNGTFELILNTTTSYFLGSQSQPTPIFHIVWPLADPNNYNCITYVYFKIDCDLNACGSTCVIPAGSVVCLKDKLVCLKEVHKECDLLRGNFEYRVKLTQPNTTNTNATIGNSCTEAAYVCFDDKCDESEPLGSTSRVPNSSTVTQNYAPYYIAHVNLTKQSVLVHVLVVQGCKNVSRVKHLVGELAVPSTTPFTLKGTSYTRGVVQLGCRAGFTGPTCLQLCDDCFVDDHWHCTDSDRLSAHCAFARLCVEQPCWNGGICAVERARNNTRKFGKLEDFTVRCECKQGYSGQFCETELGESCNGASCRFLQSCVESYLGPKYGLKSECECVLTCYNTNPELCRECADWFLHKRSSYRNIDVLCKLPANHNIFDVSSQYSYSSSISTKRFSYHSSDSFVCHMQLMLCLDNKCGAYLQQGLSFKFVDTLMMVASNFSIHLELRFVVCSVENFRTNSTTNNLKKSSHMRKVQIPSFVYKFDGYEYSRVYSADLLNGERVYVKLKPIA